MDQNSADFSVQKEALQKELLNLMINALEKNAITVSDSEKASRFILEEFEKAQSIHYLKAVVEDLAKNWPCFTPALAYFEKAEAQSEDQVKIEAAQHQLEALRSQNN